MQDPMDQFLKAMRGLEKVKTPLSVEPQESADATGNPQQRDEEGDEGPGDLRAGQIRLLKMQRAQGARRGQSQKEKPNQK